MLESQKRRMEELLEISAVAVPALPTALIQRTASGCWVWGEDVAYSQTCINNKWYPNRCSSKHAAQFTARDAKIERRRALDGIGRIRRWVSQG